MGDGLGLCEAQVHVVIAGNAVLSAPKQSACSLCVCVCVLCVMMLLQGWGRKWEERGVTRSGAYVTRDFCAI